MDEVHIYSITQTHLENMTLNEKGSAERTIRGVLPLFSSVCKKRTPGRRRDGRKRTWRWWLMDMGFPF